MGPRLRIMSGRGRCEVLRLRRIGSPSTTRTVVSLSKMTRRTLRTCQHEMLCRPLNYVLLAVRLLNIRSRLHVELPTRFLWHGPNDYRQVTA